MLKSLFFLSLVWSPIGQCALRGAQVDRKLRILQETDLLAEDVQTIASKVTDQVTSYVEENGIESPEIDLSGIAGVTENVLNQIKEAVGEENMTEDKIQDQADNIADMIAAKYIETEATDEGAQATTSFDVSSISKAISSITIEINLDLESLRSEAPSAAPTEAPTLQPTSEPTVAPTEAPTPEPTVAPTEAPTPEPTLEPTEPPTESPTENPTDVASLTPTAPTGVFADIVSKTVSILSDYAEETEVTLPTIDTERISNIAEDVLAQIKEEAGEETVTEEYLEEQSDRIASMIATDLLEVEFTEGGQPIDVTGDDLPVLISTITDITISMALDLGDN